MAEEQNTALLEEVSKLNMELIDLSDVKEEIVSPTAEIDVKHITVAIPWILQRCIPKEADKILAEASCKDYRMLLYTYSFANKNFELLRQCIQSEDLDLGESDLLSFQNLLKAKFKFSVEILFTILQNGAMVCKYDSDKNPDSDSETEELISLISNIINDHITFFKGFLKVISSFGKNKGLLHYAASCDSYGVIKMLLEFGFDINERDELGETPIFIAASNGSTKILELLLNEGGWHFAINFKGYSPLHVAVQNGHYECTKILLDKKINVNHVFQGKESLLYIATSRNLLNFVKLFLKHGMNIYEKIPNHYNLLNLATANGFVELFEIFLEAGLSPLEGNKDGETPLHIASKHGHMKIVNILLRKNTDINAKDNKKNTPLMLAITHRQREVTELLIYEGAHLDVINTSSNCALKIAMSLLDYDVVKLLLGIIRKPLPDHIVRFVIDMCDVPLIKLVLTEFISTCKSFFFQDEMVIASVGKGNLKALKCMIDLGLSVNRKSPKPETTPLLKACQIDRLDIVEYLVEQGAQVNIGDFNQTPLLCAIRKDNYKMVSFLLKSGASVYEGRQYGGTTDKSVKEKYLDACRTEKIKNLVLSYFP